MHCLKVLFSFIVGGFFLISPVYALNYDDLVVNFQNIGVENCYLVDQDIPEGQLSQSFPSVLPVTGIDNIFIIHGAASEFTLKYNCGINKIFSLHIKHYWKKGHWHRSLITDFNTTNIFEKHTINLGWKRHEGETGAGYGEPTKTTWIFSHGY